MKCDMNLLKQIGGRIKNIRLEMELTKKELGKELGVTGQFLGVVENGRSTISYEKLKKLCEFTGYTSDYILYGKKSDPMIEIKEILQNFSSEQIQDTCVILQKMANIVIKKENDELK